jgi:hypothetical protein
MDHLRQVFANVRYNTASQGIPGQGQGDQTMGKVTRSPSSFSDKLQRVVKDGLAAVGIRALTRTEKVRGTKLVRLIVAAAAFEQLSISERHDLLRRIIGAKFSPDEQMKISIVVALSKKELGQLSNPELGHN